METRGLAQIVMEHPFFVGLEEDFCDLVSGCARNVRGETLRLAMHQLELAFPLRPPRLETPIQ